MGWSLWSNLQMDTTRSRTPGRGFAHAAVDWLLEAVGCIWDTNSGEYASRLWVLFLPRCHLCHLRFMGTWPEHWLRQPGLQLFVAAETPWKRTGPSWCMFSVYCRSF